MTMNDPLSEDPIDRNVFIARSGRPHCKPIAHLTRSHSLPATANYLLDRITQGRKDPDTARILTAVLAHYDTCPDSPFVGCCKWYVEDPAVYDTNAAFFTCSPLAFLWLAHRDALSANEADALRSV